MRYLRPLNGRHRNAKYVWIIVDEIRAQIYFLRARATKVLALGLMAAS